MVIKKVNKPQKQTDMENDIDMADLITLAEAAKLRGRTIAAISELVRRGRLHSVERFGRRLVFRSEVKNFERERKGWPKGKPRKQTGKKKSSKK